MSGNSIRKSLDELVASCDLIAEYYGCDLCPLASDCIKENSVEEVWNTVSAKRIQAFLDIADNLYAIMEEEQERRESEAEEEQRAYEAEIAELQRGFDRDRL